MTLKGQFTLEDSLQLYYPFTGNANDQSGNGFDGTLNGGPSLTSDRYGNSNSAYDFDGTNDWIDTDETFDYEFRTVSVWFYPEDSTSRQIISQDANSLSYGAFSSSITSSHNLNARAGGLGSQVIIPEISNNQWYHLVLQRNADSVFYYVNGILICDTIANSGGSIIAANMHTVIGVHRSESSGYFDGKIDDIRIYNRFLSRCEIKQLYCAAAPCINLSDTIIDIGTSLTFSNVGGTNDSISWSLNGSQTSQDSSWTHTFTSSGLFELLVYASDSNCSGYDTLYIQVNPAAPCIKLSSSQKISTTSGSFNGVLGGNDQWGRSIESIGDADGDGTDDIVVTALHDDDGGSNKGAVYVLYLNQDGTVKQHHKISSDSGSFGSGLSSNDKLGTSIANIGDLNGDGYVDLAIGAGWTNEGGTATGAIWIVFLDSNEEVLSKQKISQSYGNLTYNLTNIDRFGLSMASIGDLNQDGNNDVIVGIQLDDVSGTDDGSVAVLFLNADGTVHHEQIINDTSGNFPISISSGDQFGSSISLLGDYNNDGNIDVVVGSQGYNSDEGAVYIMSLDTGGMVLDATLIAEGTNGFSGSLTSSGRFGTETETADLNNDGFQEIIVGNWRDDDGGTDRGAFWILSINESGYVYNDIKVSNTQGGFDGNLDNGDQFGQGISAIGDLNNDGITDLAVGATLDDDGGGQYGAIYIIPLFDSCCTANSVISANDTIIELGTVINLSNLGSNGDSISWKLNGNEISTSGSFPYTFNTPGIFQIILTTKSTCISRDTIEIRVIPDPMCLFLDSLQKISSTEGNFSGALANIDRMGHGFAPLQDFDQNGVTEIAIGATGDDDGGTGRGAVYIAYLNQNGTVQSHLKISSDSGGFGNGLSNDDQFGKSIARIGDLNNDGYVDIAVGAPFDDDGGSNRGAVWILFLDSVGTVASKQKISDTQGGLSESLSNSDRFGQRVGYLGDLNGDGNEDLLVGMTVDDVEHTDDGSVMILFLNSDGTVHHEKKIGEGLAGFPFELDDDDRFAGASRIGDIDGDGNIEIAIGAAKHDGTNSNEGCVYIVSLDTGGNVIEAKRIASGENGFNANLSTSLEFGVETDGPGDVNGDGYLELLVGSWGDNEGGSTRGSFWILSLDSSGYVFDYQKYGSNSNLLSGHLNNGDRFGKGLISLGDINGDNFADFAAGARFDDDGGTDRGAVYIFFGRDTCCLVEASFQATDSNICVGESITFTDQSTGITNPTYTWTINDSVVGTSQNLTYQFNEDGNYVVRMFVDDSCDRADFMLVKVNKNPIADAGSSGFICEGDTTQLNASGGISYTWDNSTTLSNYTVANPFAFPSTTTIYAVTVTDTNGCTDDDNVAVILLPNPNVDVTGDSLICHGDSSTLTASGALTYTWTPNTNISSNSGSIVDVFPTQNATYIVEGTAANGCSDTASKSIIIDTSLNTNISNIINVSCHNGNDGKAYVSATGGSAPYTFTWSNSTTNDSLVNLIAGIYTVTTTDSAGCQDSLDVTISEPDSLIVNIDSVVHVQCNGGSTGMAYGTSIGGTPTFTYLWSNGSTTESIGALTAGTYTLSITDSNGCNAHNSAVITEPTTVSVSISLDSNVSCFNGNDGSATATGSGGTAPYSFAWSSGSTLNTAPNLSAGSYTVTITDSNGCVSIDSITISQSTDINIGVSVLAQPLCNGDSNAVAIANVTGGNSPYQYLWENSETTATADSLSAGIRFLTVTDNLGCQKTASVNISEPTPVTITLDSTIDVICNGYFNGAAYTSTDGGVGGFSHSWNTGDTTSYIIAQTSGYFTIVSSDSNGCVDSLSVQIIELDPILPNISPSNVTCYAGNDGTALSNPTGGGTVYSYIWSSGQVVQNINLLEAGTYVLTVTDENSCSGVDTAIITQPDSIMFDFDTTNALCDASANGELIAHITGGTVPFTYNWSTGDNDSLVIGLDSGIYSITVTDANGCTSFDSALVSDPDPIVVSIYLMDSVVCKNDSNGAIYSTAYGGVGQYSFVWNNGSTNDTLTSIQAQSYTVTVTDTNLCSVTATYELTDPDSLLVHTDSLFNPLCHGDSNGYIYAAIAGGNGDYSYTWSNGDTNQFAYSLKSGSYSLTVTDRKGCSAIHIDSIVHPDSLITNIQYINELVCSYDSNGGLKAIVFGGIQPYQYSWNTGGFLDSLTDIKSGQYAVTVADDHGCTDTASFILYATSNLISQVDSIHHPLCFNDSLGYIELAVDSGIAPYTYSWNTGDSLDHLDSLLGGIFIYTITDSVGCQDSGSVNLVEPPQLSVYFDSIFHIPCFGDDNGFVAASATGGTGTLTFNWSQGTQNDTISELDSGNYILTVSDSNGCVAIDSIFIDEPIDSLSVVLTVNDADCFGGNTGSIQSNVSGGTGPYSFHWSNSESTDSIANVPAGEYSITVTDANGCEVIKSDSVNEPLNPDTAQITVINISCHGDSNGQLTALFINGISPFEYQWNTGGTTQTITNLSSALYSVSITDSLACIQIASDSISEPDSLKSIISVASPILCKGDSNGILAANCVGGNLPYSYMWQNGSVDTLLSNLASGVYSITTTDINGCMDSAEISLNDPQELMIVEVLKTEPLCNGQSDGSVLPMIFGGTPPYSFNWSNGSSDSVLTSVGAGIYTLIVTDSHYCSIDSIVTLNQPTQLIASASELDRALCSNSINGVALASATGGILPYNFVWSNGGLNDTLTNILPGLHSVTVTDSNNCSASDTVFINYNFEAPFFDLGSDTSFCDLDSFNLGIDDSYPNYSWSNGQTVSQISVRKSGTYVLAVTDLNGCKYNDSIRISLNHSTPFTLLDDTIVCTDYGNEFVKLVLSPNAPFRSYNWSTGDINRSIKITSTGTYWLKATNEFGCVSTDTAIVEFIECEPYPNDCDDQLLIAYPNPTRDQLTVEICNWPISTSTFTINDIHGKILERFENASRYTRIDFSKYAAGVYIIKVVGPGNYGKFRVVKI